MKKINIISFLSFLIVALSSCAQWDHEDKEFYKQEVYIISSESTAANDREITGVDGHAFVDTLRILDNDYNSVAIGDNSDAITSLVFKVGIGGSLPAAKDINVVVSFDPDLIEDYNILHNASMYLPDASLYTTNVAYDATKKGFPVVIKRGESSSELRFDVKIERTKADSGEYKKYAFPLKITDVGDAVLSRQFHSFMVAELTIAIQNIVDWSGFPIPDIPAGRWHSTLVDNNPSENTIGGPGGVEIKHKYITPLEDPNTPEAEKDPLLANRYVIWGWAVWSWEYFGYHGNGAMASLLTRNDADRGLYTLEPVYPGDDRGFTFHTFDYGSVPEITLNSKFDPRTNKITLYHKNVIGEDRTDIVTFINDDFTLKSGGSGSSWIAIKNKGYKYWLPLHAD